MHWHSPYSIELFLTNVGQTNPSYIPRLVNLYTGKQKNHHNTTYVLTLLPSSPTTLLLPLKAQGNAINTMPLIRRPAVALPFEHVPQMTTTIRTNNLRPAHAQAPILPAINSTRHTFEEGRPPASAVELARALVQRCVAARASIDSGGGVVVVGPAVGAFGATGAEDAELF